MAQHLQTPEGRVFALNHLLFHIQFYKRVLQEDRVVGDFGMANLRPLTLHIGVGDIDPTVGRDIHPDLSHINPLLLVANFPAACYDNSANPQKR